MVMMRPRIRSCVWAGLLVRVTGTRRSPRTTDPLRTKRLSQTGLSLSVAIHDEEHDNRHREHGVADQIGATHADQEGPSIDTRHNPPRNGILDPPRGEEERHEET